MWREWAAGIEDEDQGRMLVRTAPNGLMLVNLPSYAASEVKVLEAASPTPTPSPGNTKN